jgi:hypothetical protein
MLGFAQAMISILRKDLVYWGLPACYLVGVLYWVDKAAPAVMEIENVKCNSRLVGYYENLHSSCVACVS